MAEISASSTIGIITVTYNSGGVIDDFLTSLLAQTYENFVLYVVDNASEDDTLRRISRFPDPRIFIFANPDNNGVAAGNNQGIEAALEYGCGAVLLLNNDVEFSSEMLTAMVSGIVDQDGDLLVPKIFFHDQPDIIWCAGGYFNPWQAFAGMHYGIGEPDRGQYDVTRRVTYSPTCCMLIRRSVFEKIGLMDSRYFVYYDDTDFCFRAMKAGLRLVYLPQATLLHKVSSLTGGDAAPFTIRYMVRNRVYYIRKNLCWWLQLPCLFFCQARYAMRLLLRQDSLQIFVLRERSFFQGLAMPVDR